MYTFSNNVKHTTQKALTNFATRHARHARIKIIARIQLPSPRRAANTSQCQLGAEYAYDLAQISAGKSPSIIHPK